jgi:hypothetical protein
LLLVDREPGKPGLLLAADRADLDGEGPFGG